nr:hypothetical protein HK105_003101 [Polyrhizophydium stewartii]
MSPNETLFLESTSIMSRNDILSFLDFQLWDFPGNLELGDSTVDPGLLFQQCGALVFVIDAQRLYGNHFGDKCAHLVNAQDEYIGALRRLYEVIILAHRLNSTITFEVFIHKIDGLSDEHKIDTQRDIYQRLHDELAESNVHDVHLSFHLTSIYDHSIFEAFSKVIQKLIPQLPTLENLLNMLCSNTNVEKVFLFDTASKIYIATDSSPVDMQSYELCSDMIDVVMDISSIYARTQHAKATPSGYLSLQPPSTNGGSSNGRAQASSNAAVLEAAANGMARDPGLAIVEDDESHATIRLNNGQALYLRQVNQHLVLVSLLRDDSFERQGLIHYNFGCISEALNMVLMPESPATAAPHQLHI